MIPKDSDDSIVRKTMIKVMIMGLEVIYQMINREYIKKYGNNTIVFMGNGAGSYIKLSSDKQEIDMMTGLMDYEIDIQYSDIHAFGFKLDGNIDFVEKIHQKGFNLILANTDGELKYLLSDKTFLSIEI